VEHGRTKHDAEERDERRNREKGSTRSTVVVRQGGRKGEGHEFVNQVTCVRIAGDRAEAAAVCQSHNYLSRCPFYNTFPPY
jgi:hypothetical protein